MLSAADENILRQWLRAGTTPQRQVRRARIVLRAAHGAPARRVARELGVHPQTVRLWIRRYSEGGLDALRTDAVGRGRKPAIGPDAVALIHETMVQRHDRRESVTRSVASLAARLNVSRSTVYRTWRRLLIVLADTSDARRRPQATAIPEREERI